MKKLKKSKQNRKSIDSNVITIAYWNRLLYAMLKHPNCYELKEVKDKWFNINEIIKIFKEYKNINLDIFDIEKILTYHRNKFRLNKDKTQIRIK